jgi:hypothetical protein
MVLIKKIQNIYFPGALGLSLRKVHCSLEKVLFSLGNLGPHWGKLIAPWEIIFFLREHFLLLV